MGLLWIWKDNNICKIARYYQDRGLSAALICCDVTRPAAYTQLETLAKQANVAFYGNPMRKDAAKIVKGGNGKIQGQAGYDM